MKELQKMLHKCNEQLQQFSHVNKKALDQYMNFTEQREQLQKRRAELDAGDQVLVLYGQQLCRPTYCCHLFPQAAKSHYIVMLQKIKELISVLDQRKDESIERTFKGVARHFREVFAELVQGGHAYLVMMKKKVCFLLTCIRGIMFQFCS